MSDLLSGEVQVYFGPIPEFITYIRTGKLRALAVTTASRSDVLPDLPTVGDFVPGYEASGWQGVSKLSRLPIADLRALRLGAINRIRFTSSGLSTTGTFCGSLR
jgi:tripartite-type tricarboxylate transporter receptor subunit TctC